MRLDLKQIKNVPKLDCFVRKQKKIQSLVLIKLNLIAEK